MSTGRQWENKVAVITGGASGIGEATVTEFAARGARVVILDKIPPRSTSGCTLYLTCDVSSVEEIDVAAATISAQLGTVSFLVNCAGIQRYGTGSTTTVEVWDEVMSVNLKSMFLSFRALFPLMKGSGAAVVNVSSVQALGALSNSVAYVTSKHAIAGLTRALAIDHAVDGIRVNCVCPGSVDTPMLRSSMRGDLGPTPLLREIGELHALGRIARPDEIAKVIAFLCSEDSSFITGGLYVVDGGLSALIAGKPPAKT